MEQSIQEYDKVFELRDDSNITLYLKNQENNKFKNAFLEVVLEGEETEPRVIF